MTTYGYSNNKVKLTNRLKRIEGQVRGIERMIQDDTYCIDVLTQISASRTALDKVAVELLRDHANHCLNDNSVMPHGKENKADELVSAISRML